MAEFLKRVVAPSGGHYTSLEACMNANEQDLTGDGWFTIEISGDWSGGADTTAVNIHNYTTTVNDYINIYTTGTARHDGTAYKSGAYKIATVNSDAVTVASSYVTLDGLVVSAKHTSAGNALRILKVTGAEKTINNCIIFATSGNVATYTNGIYGTSLSAGTNHYVYNTIIFGINNTSGSESRGFNIEGNSQWYIYNNTVHGCKGSGVGFQASAGRVLKNNIGYDNDVDFQNAAFDASSTNNLSKDNTAPALGTYYRSKTLSFTNVTAGSEDFHLVAGDTDAIDKGADLSGTFTTDIDGTTRTGTWDIGADGYVATGSAAKHFRTLMGVGV